MAQKKPRDHAKPPFPGPKRLADMGLVKCRCQPCNVWVDPVNVPDRTCIRHAQQLARRGSEAT